MHFTKVALAIFCLVGYASGLGHGAGYSNMNGGYGLAGGIGAGHGGYGMGLNIPRPYKLQEQSRLEDGGVLIRSEVGDGSGSVSGSYGYRDQQGLYRLVDYVADAAGFRANVRTNEPGTDGKENPADVNMQVEQTPAGVVHRAQAEAARRAASRHHSGVGIFGGSAHAGIGGIYGNGAHGGIGGAIGGIYGNGAHGGIGGGIGGIYGNGAHGGIGGGIGGIYGGAAHGGVRGLAGPGGAFSAFGPSAHSQPKSAY